MSLPWRVSYRWLPRTVLPNLWGCVTDVWYGVGNVIRWAPVIWFDGDFDWQDLAEIMEYKLRRMSHHFRNHGCTEDADQCALQMSACAGLLRKLHEDNYRTEASERLGENPDAAKAAILSRNEDRRHLGRLIGKYLTHWWD